MCYFVNTKSNFIPVYFLYLSLKIMDTMDGCCHHIGAEALKTDNFKIENKSQSVLCWETHVAGTTSGHFTVRKKTINRLKLGCHVKRPQA